MSTATTLDDDLLTVEPAWRKLAEADRHKGRNFGADGPHELVARHRLIRNLEQARTRPLVVLTAPAGYGKTILLRQWAELSDRPFSWVARHEDDHEPASLAHSIAAAVGAIGTQRGRQRRFVVVLDDAQLIDSGVLEAVVPVVLGWLPDGCQLALASRCEPTLDLGHMRAHRLVYELSARDFAMTCEEAATLLAQTGLDLGQAAVKALFRRTGGWPVALELAAVSCGRSPSPAAHASSWRGDDHLMTEYLRAEILASLSPGTVRFLTRTSILERLSATLCDEVLQRMESGLLLAELARANVPLTPADASHQWYRLDPLVREMLQAELRRSEPELWADLHRRASAWYEQAGELDHAIEHARQAKDLDRTGTLLWTNLANYLGEGRNDAVQRWLGGLSADTGSARLALTAAHSHLAAGKVTLAEQWARSVTARITEAPDPATTAERAGVLIVEAWVGRLGARVMAQAAADSYDLLPEDSPWRASSCFLQGSAAILTGELPEAERILREGAARGALVARDAAALCLAQLAVVAAEQDQTEAASDFARRARAIIIENGLSGSPTCALVSAVGAVDAIRQGRVDEAKDAVSECLELLAALDESPCWYGTQTRILLARVALSLGDIPGARALLADASRLARRTPDMELYSRWFDAAWNQFDIRAEAALAQVATLTTAELRVLRFLPTHYSFQEIAQRLHVSSNTIKTHVHAVYRKLDASSRSQAVAHAIQAGLLSS